MIVRIGGFALALTLGIPAAALAWGSTGHYLISRAAAESLPANLPAFLRSTAAVDEIETLGAEEDVMKGSGESWDGDNDPGHFLDVNDEGTVAGIVRLDRLPSDMKAFAQALAPANASPYTVGFVPYQIMDGFERARKDLAYWRVDNYMAAHAATATARTSFARERALREMLTLRDIGDFGHFVADGSQPLHISIHYNGWGAYPNPSGFTTKHIHSQFESEFVDRYAKLRDVRPLITPYAPAARGELLAQAQIGTLVGDYLGGTAAQVVSLYALYAKGDFATGSSAAVHFTDAQLARGATMFRNLIALAWEDSVNESVGYPPVAVRDVLAGTVVSRPTHPMP